MTRLLVSRLIQLPILVLVIYTTTFLLAWSIPGSPLDMADERKPPPEVQAAMQAQYNLDNQWVFYWEYLAGVTGIHYLQGKSEVVFDFGPSLRYKGWTVSEIISGAFPVSLQLGLGAMLIALVTGIGAGVIGAVRRDSFWDFSTLAVALVGISLPTFVTGSVLLTIFSVWLGWVAIGWGSFSQMILPMITLSLPFAAYIARLTRMGMLDVLGSDFVRTARAKGLSEKVVVTKHALKVAFLPVLSFLGPATAGAITGSFVIEKVFNIPGMGQHFVSAVQNKDLFLIMGVVILYAILLIIFNLLVDIAYSLVDPRIQHT